MDQAEAPDEGPIDSHSLKYSDEVDLVGWAEALSRALLSPMGDRWRHTLGVVARAREVAATLRPEDAEILIAAAYLHDVGYAPALRKTGMHQLDGAFLVRENGRLAGLIAHHSRAAAEAAERGLLAELSKFPDEESATSRALTYCDMTTGPDGRRVTPAERFADVRARYGDDSPVTEVMLRSMPGLIEDVRAVEAELRRAASL